MKAQDKYSRNWKRIAGTGIAGLALAILLCNFDGAEERGCSARFETAGVAVEVLRHVVLACWQLYMRIQGVTNIYSKLWHPSGRCFAS